MNRYFIKVFGCQMNESDSQRIASFLENQGYKSIGRADSSAEALAKADLIVIVACSVRQTAIDRIFGLKKKLKKLHAKKILTGCVIKSDKKKFEEFFDVVLNINEFFKYHLFSDRTKDGMDYLEFKAKHSNLKSAFVPIMTGCDNFCSYCVVPYTRGREISRPVQKIISEAKSLVKKGYEEIILLGQNVNSYKDNKINFPKLLKMISEIPGDFIIKFLTSHPKDFSDELIDIITKSPKISKEIHLPVQSGDNEILRKMNRGYTTENYLNLTQKVKEKIPKAKFTTDIIVGFPGETEKQFQNTVKLFKKIGFSSAYINKYSARQGTAAYKFKDDIPLQEKKRRWKILNDSVNNLPYPKKLIVIIGPTASGKSAFAVKLTLRLGSAAGAGQTGQAEIISADSQQVYKGMDIGTGKISKKEMKGIPHHLLDIVGPEKQLSVAEYRKLALKAIAEVYKKGTPPHQYIGGGGKTPILCGGTGFYIRAIVDGLVIPEVKPDWKLRKKLENKTTEELIEELKKLDPNRAKNIDAKNRRRLIRALEIIKKTGKPVPALEKQPKFNVLYLGIKKSPAELKKLINQRVDKMIKAGLEKEVKNLVKKYGWTTVLKNTIGYKEFLEKKPQEKIKLHTYQFAKRQLTWFAKYPGNKKIHWVKNSTRAEKLVRKFLS